MKKFFLFRREAVTEISVTASDTGAGLSVFAVPADSIAFISSELGSVKIFFNDATTYQDENLRDGEAFEKSSVSIGCDDGKEIDLIESILSFINSESTRTNVMRFDFVEGKGTFEEANLDEINSIVKTRPINMQTGSVSDVTTRAAEANAAIAGIDFGVNQPLVDYNHEGLSSFANDAEITAWANAGSGGSTYNISSNAGTPSCNDPASKNLGSPYKGARMLEGEYFITPTIDIEGPYTLYMVFGTQESAVSPTYDSNMYAMYGDADGHTVGPSGFFTAGQQTADGSITSLSAQDGSISGAFSFRHDAPTEDPVIQKFTGPFPNNGTSSSRTPIQVLVIRRLSNNSMDARDRNGDLLAKITPTKSATLSDNLKIERIGTTNEVATNHFNGMLLRFGVIPSDIGINSVVQLATDLKTLYSNS